MYVDNSFKLLRVYQLYSKNKIAQLYKNMK